MRLREKISDLHHVNDAELPEPMPTVKAMSVFPDGRRSGREPTAALDRLRAAIQNRYGHRAPQFTERALGTLNEIERMDPQAARRLTIVGFDPYRGSSNLGSAIYMDTTHPATALHEFGHFRDSLTKPDGFFGDRPIFSLNADAVPSQLPSEASATQQAYSHLGGIDPRLAATNGTYWEALRSDEEATRRPNVLRSDVADALQSDRPTSRRYADLLRKKRMEFLEQKPHYSAPTEEWLAYTKNPPARHKLLERLDESNDNRKRRYYAAQKILTNPVAAPHLARQEGAPPRSVIEALDRDVVPGAGRAAYDYEAALKARNLAQEHPRVTQARQLLGIPYAAPSLGSRIGTAAKGLMDKVPGLLKRFRR